MCSKYSWTVEALKEKIMNDTYEHTMISQTNFERTLSQESQGQACFSIKDEYHFDFLNMTEEYSERQLEEAIVHNLPAFLREMGGVFPFAGHQFGIELNGREYFIDLLLYNRKLRCLVAVEIKVTEFKPEYVGKMLFYLTALEETIAEDYENPPIGIILCKTKDRTVVEYTIKKASAPIGVSQYQTVKELPENLKKLLPKPERIERLLDNIG